MLLNRNQHCETCFVRRYLTFAFGFIPAWSYRTVLPDWIIGLEMQFYLLFPFIMLLIMRLSFCVSSLLLMTGCLAARWLLPGYFDAFPMPSMILIKLPLFVAGMLISQAVRIQKIQYIALALLAPVVAWQMRIAVNPLRLISECAMIVGLAALLWNHQKMTKLSVLAGVPKRWFTHPVSQFLGDVSYSVYLLHLMLVIPTVGLLIHYTNFASEPALVRFSEVAVLSLPVTYLLAFVLSRKVEKSGIALGKRFISKDATQPERVIP